MTRKDYILIAGVLRHSRPPIPNSLEYTQWLAILMGLMEAFENDNPRFQHERFRLAAIE